MSEFEILDRNRDKESGELLSFLVIENGEPQLKRATSENILLYEHGMKKFLSGQHAVIVSDDNPEVIVAPTGNDMAYLIRVNGSTVETTPKQASTMLESLKDAVEADNSIERNNAIDRMVGLYDTIISTQVRRWLVRTLMTTFEPKERQRLTEDDRGWLIDGFYLVDWNANLYTIDDDHDEPDHKIGGGGTRTVDRTHEFLQLSPSKSPEPHEVSINGNSYRVSEREMLFLSKVRFMLDRRYYHPDKPFWGYTDKYAGLQDAKDNDPDGSSDDGRFSF